MTSKPADQSDAIRSYVTETISRETELQRRLRAETARLPQANMQVSADQAAFLAFLVRLVGAGRALEVGTFTGYSALAIAGALPPDGILIACDISAEWTAVGRRYWQEAGVADRIDLRLGPAAGTLAALIGNGAAGSFDFAFIDADKGGYDAYYEAALTLVRPGGLVALDNMLWPTTVDGSLADDAAQAIHALNRKIRDDDRVDASLVTVGGGMMLARKR
jgi:predicted O-methyltransferase YrrM